MTSTFPPSAPADRGSTDSTSTAPSTEYRNPYSGQPEVAAPASDDPPGHDPNVTIGVEDSSGS